MEFIEFVEKFTKKKNINLSPYQKEVIKQQAIKEGKEIKICILKSSVKSFYKEMLKAYHEEEITCGEYWSEYYKDHDFEEDRKRGRNLLIDTTFEKKKMYIKKVKDDD